MFTTVCRIEHRRGSLEINFDDIENIGLETIYQYTKYTRRSKFIAKRVRGFEECHEPTELDERFVGMEIGLFAKVVSYLV